MAVTLNINGKDVSVNADPSDTLQLVLRDDLGMTGTKFGCGLGQCGACSVILDGKAVRSCQTRVQDAVGKKVMTIEGLAVNGTLHPVQQAWLDMQVPQCGYCQSGQIMEAVAFLSANPKPTEADVRQAMAGHLCRCGTYNHITAAILKAAGTAA
ncbi:MAG: (2Fe-2S)-binding protein [Chloroflexi bacterium]|nr:(2Fe-2S)-binding protein [Chloroflexota bacterium]